MKKIGTTESGSIIVEITSDEWHLLTSSDAEALEEWNQDFMEKLRSLKLPTRIYTAIGYCARIDTHKSTASGYVDSPPHISSEWLFKMGSRVMDFDEWIKYIASQNIAESRMMSVHNLGIKSYEVFMEAAEHYLSKK